MRPFSPLLLLLPTLTSAFPSSHHSDVPAKPLPLLIWHGLGDRYDAEGLHSVGDLAQRLHPGTYIHYISVADPDNDSGSADRTASFFGNVSTQIEQVCDTIRKDPRLRRSSETSTTTPHPALDGDGEEEEEEDIPELRVDALGFSQGGQFLRGLLQRCSGLSIRSLVTFGSQHNGIARFQTCGAWDVVCKGATALVQDNVWTETVQGRVVPAQYFREVNETTGLGAEAYLAHSHFLAEINNEIPALRRGVYKERIAALEKFVMFVFEDDETVIPKESGWFADVNLTSGDVTPLRERRLYTEDWLGLKELDERGGLVFRSTPGKHMRLDEEILTETFREFFGPEMDAKVVLEASPPRGTLGCHHSDQNSESWWGSRLWRGWWGWVDNGAMVAPPVFVDVLGAPREFL